MTALRIRFLKAQIVAATHLGTLGDWWAARAIHRLEKITGKLSANRGAK